MERLRRLSHRKSISDDASDAKEVSIEGVTDLRSTPSASPLCSPNIELDSYREREPEKSQSDEPPRYAQLRSSSDNASDRQRDSLKNHSLSHHFWLWGPEILWTLISIALFTSVLAVLFCREGKHINLWNNGVTVNTIVAILATAARAAIVIPVSEGISQLKWNWFARAPRPLKDINIFNAASRGPLGGMRMILASKGQIYSITAAVILVTGLATSSMTQAAISPFQVETKSYDDDGSATTQAVVEYGAYKETEKLGNRPDADFYRDSWRALHQSIYFTGSEPDFPRFCPKKSCLWDTFSSLSVCLTMNNATSDLTTSQVTIDGEPSTKAALSSDIYLTTPSNRGSSEPSAWHLNISSPELDWRWENTENPYPLPAQRNYTTVTNETIRNTTLAQTFVIGRKPGSDQFRALELIWYFCPVLYGTPKQSYHSESERYSLNVSSTVEQITDPDRTLQYVQMSVLYEEKPMFLGGTSNMRDVLRGNYKIWPDVFYTFQHAFSTTFDGVSTGRDPADIGNFTPTRYEAIRKLTDGVGADGSMSDEEVDDTWWDNASEFGNSVANGLSTGMFESEDAVTSKLFGASTRFEFLVRVNWPWISFLGCQLLLVVFFLIIVIVDTARLGIEAVKGSDLTGVLVKVEGMGDDTIRAPSQVGELGNDVMAKLHHGTDGWTLRVSKQTEPTSKVP